MNKNRPINVNPLSIRLPLPALVSILHRLSGLLIFLVIPLLLTLLQLSLSSAEGFAEVQANFAMQSIKWIIFITLAGLLFHLIAGIRHLLMDMHIGDSAFGGRFGAVVVMLVSLVSVGFAAYWVFA